jgi:hypothetical protein
MRAEPDAIAASKTPQGKSKMHRCELNAKLAARASRHHHAPLQNAKLVGWHGIMHRCEFNAKLAAWKENHHAPLRV